VSEQALHHNVNQKSFPIMRNDAQVATRVH